MIYKLIAIALLFLSAANLSAQSYTKKSSKTIRLLTYNTHYCKGASDPGSINKENIIKFAKVIKALDADIVALQELDSASKSRGERFLLQEIAKETSIDYIPVYGNAAPYDHGSIGCGILVKKTLPIKNIQVTSLPGDETRALVRVELEKLVFMGTHFDLNDSKRKEGAQIICKNLKKSHKPLFLAGDLNDSHRWPQGGSSFTVLLKKFQIASDTIGNSIPGRSDKGALIDYILMQRDKNISRISISDTHIVRSLTVKEETINTAEISDHYPVFVDIEYK